MALGDVCILQERERRQDLCALGRVVEEGSNLGLAFG